MKAEDYFRKTEREAVFDEVATNVQIKKNKKIGGVLIAVGIILGIGSICGMTGIVEIINDIDAEYWTVVIMGVILLIGTPVGCFITGLVLLNDKSKRYKSIYKPVLKGVEYDQHVRQLVNNTRPNPREYLGLDSAEVDEIAPISFEGYKFTGATQVKKDENDGLYRSDLYEKVTIFFTKDELHVYKVFVNTLTEKVTETTDVLFYEDVVSVSTKNESQTVLGNTIEYISFNLISRGGNNIDIALFGTEDRQRSINAMRAMIKEKKTR